MDNWSNMQPASLTAAQQQTAAQQAAWGQQSQAWPQPSPLPQLTADQLAAQVPTQDRDALLQQWETSKRLLATHRMIEADLRERVFKLCFPHPAEGTNTLELGNGYELKAVNKVNYVLDKDVDKVEAALRAVASVDNEGPFIAERLVKWSAELSLSEYRELAPKYKAHIDAVLTTKPGMPSLELKEPKAKK